MVSLRGQPVCQIREQSADAEPDFEIKRTCFEDNTQLLKRCLVRPLAHAMRAAVAHVRDAGVSVRASMHLRA